ncbi:MAG: 50S ribosomal protein L19 [Nitrospirae bacterium]|nr:50S ribosomal protein L19 [Nitrospirota bacterium]
MKAIQLAEQAHLKVRGTAFRVGDAVSIHFRIREGDKERIQQFQGVVTRKRGSGMGQTFTVRKVSFGVGVERTFPFHSPLIEKIDLVSRAKVRRSRLYYLRKLKGRKARLKESVLQMAVAEKPPVTTEEIQAEVAAAEAAVPSSEGKA